MIEQLHRLMRGNSVFLVAILFSAFGGARCDAETSDQETLRSGGVVLGMKTEGDTKFVSGSILINEPPEKIWPIMANPYEFQKRIEPRMKKLEVLVDKPDETVMKVSMDVNVLLPKLNYTVDSRYVSNEKIEFKRIGGTLRDFRGSWQITREAGNSSELTYSLYIDPGFCVPSWIVREGMKEELPRTLTALRRRVLAICEAKERPETQSIMASHEPLPANAAKVQ